MNYVEQTLTGHAYGGSPLLARLHREHKERQVRAGVVPHNPVVVKSAPRDPRKEFEKFAAEWEYRERKRKAAEEDRKSAEAANIALAAIQWQSIRRIVAAVSEKYGVPINEIVSVRRGARIVLVRHIAFYLCKTITDHSLPSIGRQFGGRDHTTVLHAVRRIARLIESDHVLRGEIEELRAKLEPKPVAASTLTETENP